MAHHDAAHPPVRGARRRAVRRAPRSAVSCISRSARRRRSSARVRAMRDTDYLIGTYRTHGHALAARQRAAARHGRAVRPRRRLSATVAAARCTCSTCRGASWAATASSAATCRSPRGSASPPTTAARDDATLCQFGDGASNQGTFGETMNLAALWRLPVVFMVTNNRFGMGTSLERPLGRDRPAEQGRGLRRPGHGVRRDGHRRHLQRDDRGAAHRARGAPPGARRGADLPLPRPLDGRPRGVPDKGGGRRVAPPRPDRHLRRPARRARACSTRTSARRSTLRRSRAPTMPWRSPTPRRCPTPGSLYDDVYVLGGELQGWYSVDERGAGVRKGEDIH